MTWLKYQWLVYPTKFDLWLLVLVSTGPVLSACVHMYHHCCSLLQFHRASLILRLRCRLDLSPYAPHPQTRQREAPLQHRPNPGDQVSTGWGRGCDWSLPALAWFPSTSTQNHRSLWPLRRGFLALKHVQHLLRLWAAFSSSTAQNQSECGCVDSVIDWCDQLRPVWMMLGLMITSGQLSFYPIDSFL